MDKKTENKLEKLYLTAYQKCIEHNQSVQNFDKLASEIWGDDALLNEYENDKGLTAVILYAESRTEFKEFVKRMNKFVRDRDKGGQ